MKQFRITLLLLALFSMGGAAKAAVTLTLTDPNPTVAAGTVIDMLATAFNTDPDLVNLNNLSITLDSPLTSDDTPFLTNWLSIAGNSFFDANPQVLFTLTVPGGTTPGIYNGSVTLLGGPVAFVDQNILGSATFSVNVNDPSGVIPEPGSVTLVAAGLGLAMLRLRRQRRRARD